MGFSRLGLSDPVMQGVEAAGYTTPTPIQSHAIRPALEGRDIIGLAQTGTGKTAAFVLPLLHTLSEARNTGQRRHNPRALVLTPTRELAQQIHAAVETYGRFVKLRAIAVYGGVDMNKQLTLIRRGIDVIIATPGRLLDHLQRETIDLGAVEIFVLDEADRMLDMGFIRDVRTIIAALPAERQTMLFSATMPDEIAALASEVLRDPETIEVGERRNPVDAIEQHFYAVGQEAKTALLLHALESENMESVLVFARTKHGADKVARRLDRSGVSAAAIHSNRSQGQRDRALEEFRNGKIRVLVATDIAARGLDVDGISHVINYDIPHQAEDYLHRIGRTGRAGAEGDAITFVAREDQQFLQRIERFTGKRAQVKSYQGFVPPATQPGGRTHASANKQKESSMQPISNQRPAPYAGTASHTYQHPRKRQGTPGHAGAHGHAPTGSRPGSPVRKKLHAHTSSPAPNGTQAGQRTAGQSSFRSQQGGYGHSSAARHAAPHPYGSKQKKAGASGWPKHHPKKKKRAPMLAVRKKSPPKKLDSFSSHSGGSGWSNY